MLDRNDIYDPLLAPLLLTSMHDVFASIGLVTISRVYLASKQDEGYNDKLVKDLGSCYGDLFDSR